ncbi:MAG: 50S ribosomal protein L10 [Rickettsiales bacterium]|jgi:large subunit ribosomal protein L10|nr:50S ribosomal protein L10 [Rickettsiales bacterium]
MNKIKKQSHIDLAKEILSKHQMCILLNYKGLSAEDFVKLRSSLKDSGSNIKIIKNTLLKRAVAGTDFSYMDNYFCDQIAISYSNDSVALSGVVSKFSKENNNIKIKAACFNGKIADIEFVRELASLGSLEEVRAKFIGILRAPGSQIVRLLVARGEKLQV